MKELRRKVILPVFQLSELCSDDDPLALKRSIKQGKGREAFSYSYRLIKDEHSGAGHEYNLFPVVLDRAGVPWGLGSIFILSQIEGQTHPNMATFRSQAEDLGAYKEWLDTHENPDEFMFDFPKMKLRRPTYRYRAHIQQLIYAQEISLSTAKRRMGTIISLYRWLMNNKYFEPMHPPWEEKTYELFFQNVQGFSIGKSITTTDINIKTPLAVDPFDEAIQDGGKLRPLTGEEQKWALEAALAKCNTEMYLLQLFMLSTGARVQTACTLRIRHFSQEHPKYSKSLIGGGEVFKLKAGPSTGIDTKNDKTGVLQIPRQLYEAMRTYAMSARAKRRRMLTPGGDYPDQYLFLTQQGSPYYQAKLEARQFNPDVKLRHQKTGQTIRQFLKDQAIPYIRERHDSRFHYRIHDLRASFGMNMTELLTDLVQNGVITQHKARLIVKDLMWHSSLATTDLYLDYRTKMEAVYSAINGYGEQLQLWIDRATKGLDLDE